MVRQEIENCNKQLDRIEKEYERYYQKREELQEKLNNIINRETEKVLEEYYQWFNWR